MAVTRPSRHRRASRASSNTRLDTLEARTLLSAVINYSNLSALSEGGFGGNSGTTVDGQGNLWIANPENDDAGGNITIDKITKNADGSLTDTAFDAAFNSSVIAYNAHTNALDVAGFGESHVTQYDFNGNVTNSWNVSFLAGSSESPFNGVAQMTTTPDGAIWLTSTGGSDGNGIDYQTSVIRLGNDGSVSVASLPLNTVTTSISASSSNTLWVASSPYTGGGSTVPAGSMVQISWNGSAITATPYAIPQGVEVIGGAVAAPDGSVYYATGNAPGTGFATETDQIDHAAVVGGQFTILKEYDIPELPGEGNVSPAFLQFDGSGTLWFAEQVPSGTEAAISSLDPVTGDFTRNKLNDTNLNPVSLAVSPTDVWTTFSFNTTPPVAQDIAYISLANSSAIVATDPGIAATVNQPYTDSIAAFASSDAGDFSYTINYGNGNTGTGTITNDGSGLFYIPSNVTYAAAGNFPLSVTIVSATGDVATVHGTAVVTSPVTTIPFVAQGIVPAIAGQKDIALAPNVVGQPTLVVAQFTGAPASYTASINWGDNTSTSGSSVSIVSLGNNQYAVELAAGKTKTYGAVGTFTISVSISNGTQTVVANSTANISAVPVVASQNIILQPLLGPIVLGTVATFTADPLSAANWFKATIHWGDGSTSTGLIIRTAAGTFQVIGLHIYTKKGTFSVTTNIADSVDAETALATATIRIK